MVKILRSKRGWLPKWLPCPEITKFSQRSVQHFVNLLTYNQTNKVKTASFGRYKNSNTSTCVCVCQRHDETYREYFAEQDYPNAVYVHCFDESFTKLFAAGGPLPAGLWGNYAGLWQWNYHSSSLIWDVGNTSTSVDSMSVLLYWQANCCCCCWWWWWWWWWCVGETVW